MKTLLEFIHYLNELSFDYEIDIFNIKKSKEEYSANFEIDDILYNISIDYFGENKWILEFKIIKDELNKKPNGTSYDIQNINDTYFTIKVFSAVKTFITNFIKLYKPKEFMFSSNKKEKSRVKLYDNMAQELSKKIHYNLDREEISTDIIYRFTK